MLLPTEPHNGDTDNRAFGIREHNNTKTNLLMGATAMNKTSNTDDLLKKYMENRYLDVAKETLTATDQSEEAFLGAKAILLMHGIL